MIELDLATVEDMGEELRRRGHRFVLVCVPEDESPENPGGVLYSHSDEAAVWLLEKAAEFIDLNQ